MLYGYAALEAALGIAGWEGCVYMMWISAKKVAWRRIDAVYVMGTPAVT